MEGGLFSKFLPSIFLLFDTLEVAIEMKLSRQ